MTRLDNGPLRLLLVEDNAGDVRLLRELLKPYGPARFQVIDRPSLRAAVEYLGEVGADIVVLDLGLPDAGGLDAIARVRAVGPTVPLVVLTGTDDDAMALEALRRGAQDYLIKTGLDGRSLVRALGYAIERMAANRARSVDDRRAAVMLQSLGDALVSTDLAGRIVFVNEAAEILTGWSAEDARGQMLSEVVRVVDASTRLGFRDLQPTAGIDRATQLQSNFVLVRRNGTEVPIEGSIAPIEGPDGRVAGEVLVFRDVTAARAIVQKMAHSAQHDALTGLPNRLLLNDRIDTAISIAPRHGKKVAVLFLDLDGFKQVNDSLGHAIGDKLLQVVAGRLMGCVRGSDTVSRIGGDEFVVLLSEVERPEDAAITARRMLEAVSEGCVIDQHELRLTVSIGVSAFPEDGTNAELLIKSADAAMYQAKENGRHGYQFYKPAMNLKAVERQDVEESLRLALEREEFSLHFQPKVDLRTGEIAGAEALLRWEHPTRGPVPPSLFVPVAEASGLMQPIGSWVMREACRQTQAWLNAGLTLPSISVNVSAMELSGSHFLDGVFEALNGTGLDPRVLELELTESVLMKHADTSSSILQALRAGGVQMSIDDYGTGYSNLNYLRKFPVQTLKIDQSFVREITRAGEASVVTALLSMAQSLNLRVVAEGVETSEELAFLQDHRCDEAQGYYFSRPLPASQFARLLRDGLVATMAAREYSRPLERLWRSTRRSA